MRQGFKGIESGSGTDEERQGEAKKESNGTGNKGKRAVCVRLVQFCDVLAPVARGLRLSGNCDLIPAPTPPRNHTPSPEKVLFLGASDHLVWVLLKLSPQGRPHDLVV